MPLVSVILPTCDRPHLWPRALASLLGQTFTDFEVLLVDSNRRMPPLREHPAFAAVAVDSRVVLVERGRLATAAAARNAGLARARGEWITYLDDDDVYQPEKLAIQLARARETGSPLVVCGFTVNLPRRRRTKQVQAEEFRGDALLNDVTWGTPFLFHRRDDVTQFDETLPVGHDEVFAHAFMSRHDVRWVPNCARSLVDVYPQIYAERVHIDGEDGWRAYRKNWRVVRWRFSHAACRGYLARGRLIQALGGRGGALHFARCLQAILATRGLRSWRLVANSVARRTGLLKTWVVS